jgi:hypothetical protein
MISLSLCVYVYNTVLIPTNREGGSVPIPTWRTPFCVHLGYPLIDKLIGIILGQTIDSLPSRYTSNNISQT